MYEQNLGGGAGAEYRNHEGRTDGDRDGYYRLTEKVKNLAGAPELKTRLLKYFYSHERDLVY